MDESKFTTRPHTLPRRRHRAALAIVAALALGTFVVEPGARRATAAGTPDIAVERSVSAETLYGRNAVVTLTATNPTTTDGYNVSLRDVLPAGATLAAGSPPPSKQLPQPDGTTVLIWDNVADLQAGVSTSISYEVAYGTTADPGGTYQIGQTLGGTAGAYVNSNPRFLPRFDPMTGSPVAGSYTGSDTDTSQTTLVPFLVHKSEPSVEGELLRGVHDHQTVYTIEIENNLVVPTTGLSLVDHLPAGLEFLGCGGVDNSTPATEEHPGSGPIAGAPAFSEPCVAPTSAATVETDPDGAGPLLLDVYTRVEWTNVVTEIAAGEVYRMQYAAAIPLRENVLFGGDPTANLDNNTGDLTADEQQLVNHVAATGTTVGISFTVDDTEQVIAEDVSIHKTASTDQIVQGQGTTWTLLVESSEYATATGPIVVTDIVPNGLEYVSSTVPPGTTTVGPTTNDDGTQTVTWTLPAFAVKNGTATIGLATTTLESYRPPLGGPVSASDTWGNTVTSSTTATIITANDGTTEQLPIPDGSEASQQATGIELSKEVSELQTPMDCGDGSTIATWSPVQAGDYRPGDRVCWRLSVRFPNNLDTRSPQLRDLLPVGFRLVGTPQYTPANSVPAGDVSFSSSDGLLAWDLTEVDQGQLFQVVVETIIDHPDLLPDAAGTPDLVENLLKLRYTNTAGQPFQLRDAADVSYVEARLSLDKAIVSLNGAAVTPPASSVTASGGDTIGYQVTVTNSGDLATTTGRVRDLLPAGITCIQVVGATPLTDSCTDASPSSYIDWTLGPLGTNETATLTYQVALDDVEVPGTVYTNRAGVRDFESATNEPGSFTYVPAENIDPVTHPAATWNSERADDTTQVTIISPAIDKTSTSPVDAPGNSASQATIGETVEYTVTVTLPEGLVLNGATLTDAVPAGLEITDTPAVAINGAAQPAPSVAGNTITLALADPYANPDGADTIVLTYRAVVRDVAANQRGTALTNTATLTYDNAAGTPTSISDTATTTVVNPAITLAKDENDTDGIVEPGQVVRYTISASNSAAANTSIAYDTVVVDTLPADLIPLSGGAAAADGATIDGGSGVWDAATRTITFTIAEIVPGATATAVYDVRVADPLLTGGLIVNTVEAATTSMEGTVPGERTTGEGFAATTEHAVIAPRLSLTKSVSPATQTIGEDVIYTVDVRVPGGVIAYDATVIDIIPAGIVDVALTAPVTCTVAGGGACDPDITHADVLKQGQTYAFFLGDLAPADDDARIVRLVYSGRVAQTLAAGNTPTNSATILANYTDEFPGTPPAPPDPDSFDFESVPSTAALTVVEPHVTIDKDVQGQAADTDWRRAKPGDVLTFTLTVANAGTSTAHDVDISDTPDERLTSFAIVGTLPAGVTVTDGMPGDGTLGWNVTSIPAGASVMISYSLTVPAAGIPEVIDGAELTNTADATYLGVPAADFVAGEHKSYDDVDDDTVEVELDLASIGDRVWNDIDGDGVQDPGEPGIAGVTVTVTYLGLDGQPGGGDDEVHTTTTDANGNWTVETLPGGAYTVTVSPPAGYAQTYDLDGPATAHTAAATLGESQVRTDVDFGYRGTGSIGDRVWFDTDGDGVQDAGEVGIPGVDLTITWAGPDGLLGTADDVDYPTTTGTDGVYLVEHLPPGPYEVSLDPATLPPGFVQTYDHEGALDHAAAVTLPPGGAIREIDFGYTGSGSIGDLVWLDRDGDGAVDADEPGIPNVTLQLTWFGPDGLLGTADDAVMTTTTDADGNYLFANLPAGKFEVEVVGSLPAGVVNSYDEDGDGDSQTDVTLDVGVHHTTADFGYDATSLLGDRVWWDLDRDGVQDPGEPGIPGVAITVTYAGPDGELGTADDLTFDTTTGDDGAWLISGLPLGAYRVEVTGGVPSGMTQTFDADGVATPDESQTALSEQTPADLDQDFGYAGAGSIGDLVWLDRDGDGEVDPDEPGLPGVDVIVTWFGPDGEPGGGDDLTVTVTTDGDGGWSVPGLPAGTYSVVVDPTTLPADLVATYDLDGTPNGATVIDLPDGGRNDDVDFGYRGVSSIGDTIVWDRDDSGSITDGDVPLGAVTVVLEWAGLDGVWGTPDDETFTTTTAADGTYLFTGLPAGLYTVTVDTSTLPPGLSPTFDEDGGLDSTTDVALAPGEAHLSADFGYTGAGAIGDTIYLDLDGDGVQGPDEPGVPGQQVDLVWHGPTGTVRLTTVAGPDGSYLFEHLPDGDYRVEVVGGIAGAASNTADPDGETPSQSVVTIAEGASDLDQDFGYQGSGSIGDTIWFDVDADGVDDGASEPRLPGITVVVTWLGVDGVPSADDLTFTTTTGPDGTYLVEHLPAGNYTVAVTAGVPPSLAAGVDADSPAGSGDGVSALTLSAGESNLGQDFGYVGSGSIGDTVWLDVDADGVQDPGEPGLGGVTVTLTFAGLDGVFATPDDLVYTTTTDGSGHYLFDHLAAGSYRLDVTGVAAEYHPSGDPDGGLDNTSVVTIGTGEHNTAQDFGYAGGSSLNGTVFHDSDHDGLQGAGEGGVAGITITVIWDGPAGPVTITTVTGPDGTWSISNLPAGSYTVTIDTTTLPTGFSPTTATTVAVTVPSGGSATVVHGIAPALVPPAPPGPTTVAPPAGGALPATGGGGAAGTVAVWTLALGLAALLLARRRATSARRV